MNKKIIWTGRIISALVGIPFLFSAMTKIFWEKMFPDMPAQMEKMGLAEVSLPMLAALELTCVVIYLIPATSVLGAVLLTGYLGGAMLTHLRINDAVTTHIVLGLLLWLGIYLREPRLHAVLPFRRK